MTRWGLRERFRRNPMWGDALVMLLVAPYTLTFATASPWFEGTRAGQLPAPVMWLWGLLYTLPLLWRRTRPEVMAVGLFVAHLLQLFWMPSVMPSNLVVPIAVYALARYAAPRRARFWLAVVMAGALVAAVQWSWSLERMDPPSLLDRLGMAAFWFIACTAVVLATWFWGQWARQKDITNRSWRERAEALERERQQGIALVAQEERNRLAREMHDIVAHSLSVIVVQADGAGYLAGHDELGDAEARLAQVTKAIETIGQTARTALGETRRLVGVLRQEGEDAEMAPAATVDQIADLVAQLQSAGVPTQFHVEGSPDEHPELGEGAQMALYRVAQESLTNVMKHAGQGATVAVTVQHNPDGVTLRVADTGAGPTETDGLGHGLVGMRERMTAWGGQLNAGPRRGGGFEVYATMPAAEATRPSQAPSMPTNEATLPLREDTVPLSDSTPTAPDTPWRPFERNPR